ncbi:MAG: hypothetical protein OK454_02815 [Thaumarchaeota archaeon]|nr:hypothetical protein [Nitrososphaerota archaeon]MDA4136711.1 hypothetical protein [Nitrososphaerota archaeon]
MILNTVVLWAHIFGVIGWMGAAMVFGLVIGPALGKASPQARAEFFAKIVPRYLTYIEVFSIITVVFGVAMVAVLADGDFSIMSPTTTFGFCISAGAILALVAIGMAMGVIVPTAKKMSKIAQTMLEKPGPPPPEMASLSKRLKTSTTAALGLLVVVTVLMVAAATY